jgi:mannose-6-phosphate isomerase-like protein (cupin superfamily)
MTFEAPPLQDSFDSFIFLCYKAFINSILDEKKALKLALAALAVLLVVSARGQQKAAAEAGPSYREDAPSNRRQPGVEMDVSFYINHWRNSPAREGHGGLIERDILTRGNPFNPKTKGAVLRFLSAYRRAELPSQAATSSFADPREQVFLFVLGGAGRIEAAGRSVELEEGLAVVIPAGIAYRLFNPSDGPLELFLAAEETPDGFIPERVLSVGRFRDSLPLVGAHWAHIARPFIYDHEPKFANPMGFVVVSMDEFDIAQPHTHPAAAEEVWLQVKGKSLLLLGNRLLSQEPGEAFLVPPTNTDPHSTINPGGEPQLWLFFGCRK